MSSASSIVTIGTVRYEHARRLPLAISLYKFCKSEHLHSATRLGQFRLGTLRDFASNPNHGELVRDESEGTMVLDAIFPHYTPSQSAQYPGMLRHFPGVLTASMANCGFYDNTIVAPNYLIFSASTTYSEDMHIKWSEEEGYDSCYQINSGRLFISSISRALGSNYKLVGARAVVYASRLNATDPRSDRNPVFVKRQDFHATEAEFRIAWRSLLTPEPSPIIITAPEATKYLSPLKSLSAA